MTARAWWIIVGAALLTYGGKKAVDTTAWEKYTPWDDEFKFSEEFNSLPAGLLKRQAWQESRYKPTAKSPAGAYGLMQFMPATWAEWGRGYPIADPVAQIRAAGRYMAWLHKQTGSWSLALAAYNWGIGNVSRKVIAAGVPLSAVAPAETRAYVADIAGAVGVA